MCTISLKANPYLVHVIPDERRASYLLPPPTRNPPSPLLIYKAEETFPPFRASRIKEVNPGRASTPTPSFVIIAAGLLNNQASFFGLRKYRVVLDTLEVGVDDNDHLDVFI